jgi:hypothetical protein
MPCPSCGAQHFADAPVGGGGRYAISGQTDLDDLNDQFKPATYKYIDPRFEPRSTPNGGRYAGVFAQDLQAHPLGAQIVKDTPEGKKLEGGPLMSALAAMAGRHHDRLNDHEEVLGHHSALHQETESRLKAMEQVIAKMKGRR